MPKCPAFPKSAFDELFDCSTSSEVEWRWQDTVDHQLHGFLNQLPSLADVQAIRQRCRNLSRTCHREAYDYFKAVPRHWYTFNHGGRNEVQFNLGMYDTHLRVGLGFNFTKGGVYGKQRVPEFFAVFKQIVVSEDRSTFQGLAEQAKIGAEWRSAAGETLRIETPQNLVAWLEKANDDVEWIFIGRLLSRDDDQDCLADSQRLGTTIDSVLGKLKPYWEETQRRVNND